MSDKLANAAWTNPAAVPELYPWQPGAIWLGRAENGEAIGYADNRSVLLTCSPRGGKGASVIVPTLLTWRASVVVIDPKGENATISAARRGGGSRHAQGMGQAVHVLDPFRVAIVDEEVRSQFNPLDALDPEDPHVIDDASAVADAIVIVDDGSSKDPFWDRQAREMVRALILHVITAPQYRGRRNLVTVRRLVMSGDWEQVESLEEDGEDKIPSGHELLWMDVRKSRYFPGVLRGLGDAFLTLAQTGERTYDGILASAQLHTSFLDSPPMAEMLSRSDFSLKELKTRPEGMSLFLSLPAGRMASHDRWLRMMIVLTMSEMERTKGRPAAGDQVLVILDEMPGLRRLRALEDAAAQLSGAHVKLMMVVQTLSQLHDLYKQNWETLVGVCGLKIFFSIEDNFTREYVSKQIGETEMMRVTRNSSRTSGTSDSVAEGSSSTRTDGWSWNNATGWSKNVTAGTSGGTSYSVSKGTSDSIGTSWGLTESMSFGRSGLFGTAKFMGSSVSANSGGSSQRSTSSNVTDGTNFGWNRSSSDGFSGTVTDGTSGSDARGTSHTLTRSTNEGTSAGIAETFHVRPLIDPAKVGREFVRVSDKADLRYPGLALVLIEASQMVVRRINYFEDGDFIGLFDPHPDHKFLRPIDRFEYRRTVQQPEPLPALPAPSPNADLIAAFEWSQKERASRDAPRPVSSGHSEAFKNFK